MNKKRILSIVAFLGCWLSVTSAHAVVSIGPNVIVKGNTIEVVGPGPDVDIQAIIDSIDDEASDNPYLIKLGSGVYTLTPLAGDPGLQMAPYISIMGSGQGVTILTGAIDTGDVATSAVVRGASFVTLSHMSVENTVFIGVANLISAIVNESVGTRIEHVTATATSSSEGVGVSNIGPFSLLGEELNPILNNITATGGRAGVMNADTGFPTLINVKATGILGGANSFGVYNIDDTSPTLTNVIATAKFATNNYGVLNVGTATGSTSPTLTNVTATGEGGTNNYGVSNGGGNITLKVYSSVLTGSTAALDMGSQAATRIANSVLNGNLLNNAGGVNCGGVYNVNLAPVTC